MNNIMVFTSICEEDNIWIDQYLAEIERLDVRFAIHLDRCSGETKERLVNHKLCAFHTTQDVKKIEFTEKHKQKILNLVVGSDATWALAWDVDETFETDAAAKFSHIAESDVDVINIGILHLWGDRRHYRSDSNLDEGSRERMLNVGKGSNWIFRYDTVNGPRAMDEYKKRTLETHVDRGRHLECLHWGFMDQELREYHKERWDRIYGRAMGRNPYGFWDHILNPNLKVEITEHNYLDHLDS